MVNVPGGSKACGNCKRRKLKCDEARPACQRCKNSRIGCDGYASRPMTMYTSRQGSKSGRAAPTPSFASEQPPETTTSSPIPDIPGQVPLLPQKEAIHLCFISALIDRKVLINDIPNNWQPWVTAIAANERTGVASQAASALAAVHFASLYDCSAQDMAFARMQYAGAIQTLSKNLADERLSHDVGNVAAVLFLFWCEIATEAMNGQAFAQHNEGLARLVEHIGPYGHQNWLARKNLMMSRMNIIFFALQQRKHTFLSHPSWKTIPWSQTWISKTWMQRLLDIAADVPGLLEDADNLDRSFSSQRKVSLQQRTLSTLQSLCQWRYEWQRLFPEAAFTIDRESYVHRTLLQIESPTFADSIWFHHFARAHGVATYDAILLILLDLAQKHIEKAQLDQCLDLNIPQDVDDTTPQLLPHPRITQQEIAEEVFQMANYFLHRAHRASGALAVYYALWACQATLHPSCNKDKTSGDSLWNRLRLLVRSLS